MLFLVGSKKDEKIGTVGPYPSMASLKRKDKVAVCLLLFGFSLQILGNYIP